MDIFQLLHLPSNFGLDAGYREFYIVECVVCCIPIKNVGLCSGMQFSYLGSVWSFWGLLSHFFICAGLEHSWSLGLISAFYYGGLYTMPYALQSLLILDDGNMNYYRALGWAPRIVWLCKSKDMWSSALEKVFYYFFDNFCCCCSLFSGTSVSHILKFLDWPFNCF